MDEKIKNLWNNNKILFFILIPLIILYVLKDVIFALLGASARKTTEKAKEEDSKLKDQANQANLEAEKLKSQADSLEEKIDNRTSDDVPEDWHKRK